MRFGVLLYHHVNELDAVGPVTLLNTAKTLAGADDFEVCTLAKSRNSVQTAAELTLTPTWAFASAPTVDVLIVPGGPGALAASRDRAVRRYVEGLGDEVKLYASVSSGALLLGELGLLRGRPVTTHPDLLGQVETYEVLRVSRERLVKSDGLWTAGGSSAGLELGLELVRRFASDEAAKETARLLDITVSQPGLF